MEAGNSAESTKTRVQGRVREPSAGPLAAPHEAVSSSFLTLLLAFLLLINMAWGWRGRKIQNN